MSKPNKEKLLERINNMKSICSDGRREIKELVSELIGEPLEKPTIEALAAGDVVQFPDGDKALVVSIRGKLEALNGSSGFVANEFSESRTPDERLKYYQDHNVKLIGKARFVIDPA